MTTASHQIVHVLDHLVKVAPVGTNRALLQLMWAMVSGAFLHSRGAVHSALLQAGFAAGEIRRSWQALRYGVWHSDELLARWRNWVKAETDWQPNRYAGWQPLAIDITGFWRPRLHGWVGRCYHQLAQRLLPSVTFAVVVQVGQVGTQRLPLLRKLLRGGNEAGTEAALKEKMLSWARRHLGPKEVLVCDAGVKVQQMQAAGVARFVLRLARNCTARRNELPPQSGRGRPREYGQSLRPLARTYDGHRRPASTPDVCCRFRQDSVTINVHGWRQVVRSDQKVSQTNATFTIWVYFDPRFQQPLLLATNLDADAATVFRLYCDRWPVEQVPLVAKQLLGLQRHFVFAPASTWRLPELALLMGNILTVMATVLPPLPSGYWDRHPKKRQDDCDALSNGRLFQILTPFRSEFGKKRRERTTCRRELRRIDECRRWFRPNTALLESNYGPHC